MIRNDTALAESDVKHLIHGFTNLTRHEAQGPKIIVRGEDADLRRIGKRLYRSGRRHVVRCAGLQ